MDILKFVVEFATTPALIVGVVAFVGLLLQGKTLSETIVGSLKTALGLLILSIGAGAIVNALLPFVDMFNRAFGLSGVVPFDEAVIGALSANVPAIARATAIILAVGFLVNVLVARLTPLKYIFLTGHMMWIMAGGLAWTLTSMNLPEPVVYVVGSLIQGIWLAFLPALAQPMMRRLTGSDDFAYGHLTTIGVLTSAYVGKLVGRENDSAEEMEFPERLSFFRDMAVSIPLVMLIIYLVTALALFITDPVFLAEKAGDKSALTFSVIQALTFAAGVLVLLQGVRMFIGEIVPAFRGIALRVVPGARPALDCPVVFPYAPVALLIGFIFTVVGEMIGLGIAIAAGLVIPLPSIIGAFFTGGVAGIFGNLLGGRRAAAVAGIVYGLWLTIPPALFYPLLPLEAHGVTGIAFLVPDGIILLAVITIIGKLLGLF